MCRFARVNASTVAEQHNTLSNVQANSLTFAPTQIVNALPSAAQRGWTEALLRGPLERAGLSEKVEEANAYADNQEFGKAAELFVEVAGALTDSGYEPAAQQYISRAARAYVEGDERHMLPCCTWNWFEATSTKGI